MIFHLSKRDRAIPKRQRLVVSSAFRILNKDSNCKTSTGLNNRGLVSGMVWAKVISVHEQSTKDEKLDISHSRVFPVKSKRMIMLLGKSASLKKDLLMFKCKSKVSEEKFKYLWKKRKIDEQLASRSYL